MAPPKSKADGEGKRKAVATTPSPRMTRSDTRRSGSSSQLVSLESVEKKKRKTKAKTGGATKKRNKEEEGENEAVEVKKEEEESADEEDDDDAAAEEEEAEEEDEDSEKKKIVIEHWGIETKHPTYNINSEEKEKELNEIDAKVEQLLKEPTQLVSSFQQLQRYLPATPESSYTSDPVLSMYTRSSEVPLEQDSSADCLFLPKTLRISGMPKNITPTDIENFFKKNHIEIESVDLGAPDEENLTADVFSNLLKIQKLL